MKQITKEWFDQPAMRRGTGCMKWDAMPSEEVIPLWVADMDFRTAPVITEALKKRIQQGIFGYTLLSDRFYESFVNWFRTHHQFSFDKSAIIPVPGIVPAISAIIKALSPAGSSVIIQTPVYNCFFSSIRNNGCEIADAPLKRVDLPDGKFTYEMDFEALRRQAAREDTHLMLLCNPHNPAGRVWRCDELQEVADICSQYGVTVVSDEIHCDITRPGLDYVSYATIDPSAILCLSPSKAFNIAGLQIAGIIAPDEDLRARIDKAVNINEICDVNCLGPEALMAAYSENGFQWLSELRDYIWDNYNLLVKEFRSHLPQCCVSDLQGTYLPWIDISSLGVGAKQLEMDLVEKANVRINDGVMYGLDGYIRINIACPRQQLQEGLNRIFNYIETLL